MFNFKELPELEDKLGPILDENQICPGVYLLTAKNNEELFSGTILQSKKNL